MKFRKIALIIITLSVSTLVHAQQNEKVQLEHSVTSFFDALSNRDSIRLRKFCTPAITLVENGSVWNADTLILKAITLNTSADFKRANNFRFINTTVNGKTGWSTYNLHSAITRNGKQVNLHWIETIVAVKEREQWKIQVLHSTLIKRD